MKWFWRVCVIVNTIAIPLLIFDGGELAMRSKEHEAAIENKCGGYNIDTGEFQWANRYAQPNKFDTGLSPADIAAMNAVTPQLLPELLPIKKGSK